MREETDHTLFFQGKKSPYKSTFQLWDEKECMLLNEGSAHSNF